MNEKIAKGFYDTVVVEGVEDYRILLEEMFYKYKNPGEKAKRLVYIYENMSDEDKKIFYSYTKQVIIDTISHVFGIIDGPCTFSVPNTEFKLYVNGIDSDMEMQDTFLAYVEELESENLP
jgi:hypothetical protein